MTRNIIDGQLIGGRYIVEAVLGRGAMASVYRAVHVATERPCALKVALLERQDGAPVSRSFTAEAKIGALVGDHPHVATAFDAGLDEATGRPFLAMPLFEGETLEARLERGPFDSEDVRAVVSQVADALQQAHEAGVVHRDLKPSNLFLVAGREGVFIQVLDFGLAKVLSAGAAAGDLRAGTLGYAAPEQLGDSIRRVASGAGISIATTISPATDVWPLALIAYEMLTGHTGWQYWNVANAVELPEVVATTSHRPSERAGARADLLPPGFDAWFARATAKDAAARTPTVVEAAEGLCRLLDVGGRRSLRSMRGGAVPLGTTLPPLSEPPSVRGRRASPASTPERAHEAVARRPLDPHRLRALYDTLGSDVDRRARVAQVLALLDAADDEQRSLADKSVAASHIRPRRPLRRELLEAHLHHPHEGPITSALLASISRALLAHVRRRGGESEAATDLVRDDELGRCFAWAATVLGMREPRLYHHPEQGIATRLTTDHPPDLRLGAALSPGTLTPRELAFVAGRGVATTAPVRMMRWLVADVSTLKDALAAAVFIVAPDGIAPADRTLVAPIATALEAELTGPEIQVLRREHERFVDAGGRTHVGMWADGAQHTVARAGLLLCDDIAAAARMLERDRVPQRRRLVSDLVSFFTSRDYRVLREAMGLAPPTAATSPPPWG